MAKKNVNIKVTADGKDAESGINKVTSSLNKLNKQTQNSGLAKFQKAYSGLSKTLKSAGIGALIGAEIAILKKMGQTIKETAESYNTQIKAETSLAVAAKNNPYLDESSVDSLKKFASAMQEVSTVGDEQMLPLMAELASAGRTQEEIQDIMSAALDASASGAVSLDSAVKSLNSAYGGSIGELGKLVPSLKNLTTEQLKNGEATKIVKENFNGMAESMSNLDTATKAKNLKGDYLEQIGRFTKPAYDAWNNMLSGMYKDSIAWWDKLNTDLEEKAAKRTAKATTKVLTENYKEVLQKSGSANASVYLNDAADATTDAGLKNTIEVLEAKRKLTKEEQTILDVYRQTYSYRLKSNAAEKTAEEYAQKLATMNKTQLATEKARLEKDLSVDALTYPKLQAEIQKRNDEIEQQEKKQQETRETYRQKYNDDIAQIENEIKLKRDAGVEVSEQEEAQQKLNKALEDYVKMYSDPAFDTSLTKTGVWAGQAEQQQQIAKWAEKAGNKVVESANAGTEALNEEKEAAEEVKNTFGEIWNTANSFVSSLASSMSEISEMVSTNAENNATVATAEIEQQLADGLISEEEYADKKEEIEKEAAEKSYRMQMWAWGAQLLNIAASTATSIMQVYSDPTLVSTAAKAIMAASIGLTGSTQLAAAIANKPTPPSYATGGFLLGSSTSGDKIPFKGNAGESILNPAEMRTFMAMANGEYKGQNSGLNVEIKNYKGNDTKVSSAYDGEKLRIIVNGIVNDSMASGKYNQSLVSAQNRMNGVMYTN